MSAKIKTVTAICIALLAAAGTQIAVTKVFSIETNITEAFATNDDIEIDECSVETTAGLSWDKSETADMGKELLKEVFESVDSEYSLGKVSSEYMQNDNSYKAVCESTAYSMYATVTWSDELQHTYFHFTANMKHDMRLSNVIKERVENVVSKYTSDVITFIRIDANKYGKITEKEADKRTEEIFERLGALSVKKVNGDIYTQYGYSEQLDGEIKTDDDMVNVQVSYNYNEGENITEISVGTPIINGVY